jgi:hypothetical protein
LLGAAEAVRQAAVFFGLVARAFLTAFFAAAFFAVLAEAFLEACVLVPSFFTFFDAVGFADSPTAIAAAHLFFCASEILFLASGLNLRLRLAVWLRDRSPRIRAFFVS